MGARFFPQVGSLLALLVVWEILTTVFGVSGHVMPRASTVLQDMIDTAGLIGMGTARTLTETLLGFAIGGSVGFAFGAAFAQSRVLEKALLPLFILSQAIPVIAFGALVVMWMGNGIWSKVAIAAYLTAFPVTVSTCRGLLSVDAQRVSLLRSFGAGGWTVFWRLRVPTAMPTIMAALRLGVSLSLIGAIVGEWFGDTIGLGILLLQAMYMENMPRVWAVIVVCGLIGIVLYALIETVERRWVWWKPEI